MTMEIILHQNYFKNFNWSRVFSQYRIACDDNIDTNNNDDKDYDDDTNDNDDDDKDYNMTMTMILMITMTITMITTCR